MQPQFGSGSPLLGGQSPLQQVAAQAGINPSQINMQSPASAGFDPTQVPPAVSGGGGLPSMNSTMPQNASTMPVQPSQAPQASQLPKSEAELIVQALSERLKQLGKIEYDSNKLGQPVI